MHTEETKALDSNALIVVWMDEGAETFVCKCKNALHASLLIEKIQTLRADERRLQRTVMYQMGYDDARAKRPRRTDSPECREAYNLGETLPPIK